MSVYYKIYMYTYQCNTFKKDIVDIDVVFFHHKILMFQKMTVYILKECLTKGEKAVPTIPDFFLPIIFHLGYFAKGNFQQMLNFAGRLSQLTCYTSFILDTFLKYAAFHSCCALILFIFHC